MKSFVLAVLTAGALAHEDVVSFDSNNYNSTGELFENKIKAWNCATCALAFKGVDKVIDNESFQGGVVGAFTWACKTSGLVLNSSELCPGMVKQYVDPLMESLSTHILAKDHMCNEVLKVCKHPDIEQVAIETVVNKILSSKPKHLENDDFVDKLYEEIAADPENRETIKAVHISDVHLDQHYMAGSASKCESFLCCRADTGMPGPGESAAGLWGSNEGVCDIPK